VKVKWVVAPAGAASLGVRQDMASALGLLLTIFAFFFALAGPVASANASGRPGGRTVAAKKATLVRSAASATTSPPKTSPSDPPLTSPPTGAGVEDTAGVQSLEGDQLVENGLSSPLCESGKALALSSVAQSNCRTSGFLAAPAPTNNYDLDVNIDTGTLGLGNGQLLSVIQDVFVAPIWEGLVWLVHALVVMLQWCYTLELLGGSMTSGLRSSLREAQTSFTEPWLALVLAVASVLVFYNGLIRRRIGETVGQALLTIAMMAAGFWLIANPLGTVGVVGQFANQASLGTLGAVAQGSTANAPRTLGDSMRALFASAIEVPWCYLEFGEVRWCSDPALLEPRLRKAALAIVASQQAKLNCRSSSSCPASPKASAVARASELVDRAETNGALVLAFPANGPERNSSKNESSLLHVLCQSENDSKCEGSTATQAEFRSDGGTFPRMLGVVLIAVGVIGMAMLFGLIAIHLLASALISLLMLLAAPFIVLAPALGDTGRNLFSGWLTRLLGSICSKLIFSFLLGVLLTMQRMLVSLAPLGWWTQWLLISAFWWVVFLKRHQALAFVRSGGRAPLELGGKAGGMRQAKQDIAHPVRWAKNKLLSPLPADEQLVKQQPTSRVPGQQASPKQAPAPTPGPTGPAQPSTEAAGQSGLTGESQSRSGGANQPTGAPQRQQGGTDELSEQGHIERPPYAGAAGQLGRDGGQTRQAGTGAGAVEPRAGAPGDPAGSEAPGGATASRRNQAKAEKPPRGERLARVAAYMSDPEADEAALLASMPSRRPAPSQQQAQPQPATGRQPPPRAAAATAGLPARGPASDPATPDMQSMRMRTSREIMDDAREVAAGRKRQLGIESLGEAELEP
jgi:TrbL/VirB6 plasmid conjugal transfer protein